MKLAQLRQLLALQEYGTFSRAAQALYISQPSLSTSVQKLEEELGVQLIFRGRRGVLFTPVGLAVLEQTRNALQNVSEIYHICADAQLSGTLRLASTPHYCTSILLEVKLDMEQAYPALSVHLEENDSNSIWSEVEGDQLDAGLIQLCDVEEEKLQAGISAGTLRFVELFTERMCVAVNERHPLSQQAKVEPAELLRYPYGSYKKALNTWMESLRKEYPDSGCRVFYIDDIDPLRILLVRKQAFTIIPLRSIQYGNALYLAKMTALPVNGPPLTTKVGLVYKEQNRSTRIDAMIDILRDRCRQYQNQP